MNLIKILSLTTIVSLFCLNSFGQKPINFGFKGGTTFSKYIDNIDTLSQSNQTGWQGGLFARVNIKKLYIGADALVTSKPGQFESKSGLTTGEIQVNSLDVPLVLGYKIIKTKVFKARLYAGPTAQFNFREKVKTSFNGVEVNNSGSWDFKGGPHWSINAGAGIDIMFVTLDLTYLYSVSNWSNTSSLDIRNQGFQINLGFKII